MSKYECLECAHVCAPHLHPDYSNGRHADSDHLCDQCLISLLEEKYDVALKALREAVEETGVVSVELSFIDAAEKRDG